LTPPERSSPGWPIARPAHAWATGALWAALTVAFEATMTRASGASAMTAASRARYAASAKVR
jgi:hypothetical protein